MNTATPIAALKPAAPATATRLIQAQHWIETPTALKVVELLSYAQVARDVVVIYGPGGIGKSEAATHYAATRNAAHYIAMSPATSGVVPALQEIAEAVGGAWANGAAAVHRAIVDALSYGSGELLIVDEAQSLSDAALDQLRAIHDAARVGVALIGSPALYSRLNGGDGAVTLDGLRNRIGRKLGLSGVMPGDVDAVLDAWAITDAKLRRTLVDASAKPGGMRNVAKALRLAVALAERESRTPGEADVRGALRELGG